MADRLDQPLVAKRSLKPQLNEEAFGRFAERIARFLGTPRFIVWQSVIVFFWIIINAAVWALRWDPYPFILLNLAFSTQAAYAAPLILLAQNRQTDRDKANLVEDRQMTSRALDDTEYLVRELADVRLSIGDVVTRDFLRESLRELLEAVQTPGETTAAPKKAKKRKVPRPEEAHDPTPGPLTEPQQPDSRDLDDEPIGLL